MSDMPIEEQEYIIPHVVDLGEVRVARGMSRRPAKRCAHRQLIYDRHERRVWCEDCETTVDTFDAFMVLVEHFQSMSRAAEAKMQRAQEAEAAVVHRIAAREVERIWRGKDAVTCPHCRRGILPTDRLGLQSQELEMARRRKA